MKTFWFSQLEKVKRNKIFITLNNELSFEQIRAFVGYTVDSEPRLKNYILNPVLMDADELDTNSLRRQNL